MRIMGVDPGLTRCGIGIIDSGGGRKISMVDVEVARTKPELAPHYRLLMIWNEIEHAITFYKPDVLAVERVFAQENVRSVTGTAQVVGIVMLAAAKSGLPLGMHTPSEVKAAVTGSGRAEKAQVQMMVQRILQLAEPPRPRDAADALAIAICHAWRGGAVHKDDADRSQHGGAGMLPRAEGEDLTPAQRMWANAERLSRRHGAVEPKRQ
ncbi:crossover junction endodeoxyribonuclease RuvC [Trueperella bonasi]|uniref:Crossover junction endodeoxyribonuclease RuvC n=1 Tax=Trueperella bonasi TaxID=312286 RepID=A0ABT9NIC8_9ACTO|nr:crossover junction endodeoxyribonuclease RuvC [Trueperella bonasi]MDP9807159.1 crossover junction endodeoxyribonuclease RuvC [Trueperella bonasi]